MSPDRSRRNFLKFAPGAIALCRGKVLAQNPLRKAEPIHLVIDHPDPVEVEDTTVMGCHRGRQSTMAIFSPAASVGTPSTTKVEVPHKPRKIWQRTKSMREDVQSSFAARRN